MDSKPGRLNRVSPRTRSAVSAGTRRRRIRVLLFLFSGLVQIGYPAGAETESREPQQARPLRILRINPGGADVPPGRQIVFTFDRAVVPVGRMDRDAEEIPIEVTPDPGCEWRWLDTSALACQLGEGNALRPSTRYEIVVRPGIRAADGGTLAEPRSHSFVTRRPKVIHSWFQTWASPGTPHVRVTFDQQVTRASIRRHLWFELPGGARVPTQPSPLEGSDTAWIVAPANELPVDEQIALYVAPGVESVTGNEPGVEDREIVTFRTFPEHRFVGLECRDNDGDSLALSATELHAPGVGCDPLGGVELVFSSPSRRSRAGRV